MIKWGLAIIVLTGALVSTSAGAAIYVYSDASGTHYTDKPVHGAKRVNVPKAQSYSPGNLPPPATFNHSQTSNQGDKNGYYQQINLTSPQPKQTFRSAERLVPVQVSVKPGLRATDRIMIYHDGNQALPSPTRAMSLTLKISGRGAQQVSAAVIDSDGKRIASSSPVSFFMKPPTVSHPGALPAQ